MRRATRRELALLTCVAVLVAAAVASVGITLQADTSDVASEGTPPTPRFFWTVYAMPVCVDPVTCGIMGAPGMWAPFGESGGPFVQAFVKAKYDSTWYAATLDQHGRITPSASPPWPRPDLIQLAGAGVQASRTSNPVCGRPAGPTVPPCYLEMVYPLVFLDKLAIDGPALGKVYLWISPAKQIYEDSALGGPTRLFPTLYRSDACPHTKPGRYGQAPPPIYVNIGGEAAEHMRVDTCYEVPFG